MSTHTFQKVKKLKILRHNFQKLSGILRIPDFKILTYLNLCNNLLLDRILFLTKHQIEKNYNKELYICLKTSSIHL